MARAVEGGRLKICYGFNDYRGFEPPSLHNFLVHSGKFKGSPTAALSVLRRMLRKQIVILCSHTLAIKIVMDYDKHFEQMEAKLAHLRRQLDLQGERIDSLPKLTSRQANKTDKPVDCIAAFAGRIRRLEDAVFNKAS